MTDTPPKTAHAAHKRSAPQFSVAGLENIRAAAKKPKSEEHRQRIGDGVRRAAQRRADRKKF